MIKIFEKSNNYSSKVNFVDENNVFVGFDTQDVCCAEGGWFISKKISKKKLEIKNQPKELRGYFFDVNFKPKEEGVENGDGRDDCYFAIFKLISKTKKPLYLHLFNCHNGYYVKGFYHNVGGVRVEGEI